MTGMGAFKPCALPQRIADYFVRNPNEELSHDDACIKFNCTKRGLSAALVRLRARGSVESVRVIRGRK